MTDELERARQIAAAQAEDEGLWCVAETAMEAHLQKELRRLTEAVEGKSVDECAEAALSSRGDAPTPLKSKDKLCMVCDTRATRSFLVEGKRRTYCDFHEPKPPISRGDAGTPWAELEKLIAQWEEAFEAFTSPFYAVTTLPDPTKTLRQCIDELRAVLCSEPWVRVADRMPEYDTDVVLWAETWPCVYIGYYRHVVLGSMATDPLFAEEIAGLLIVEGSEHNGLVNEIRTVLSRHMAPERSAWAERESAWQAEREQWKALPDEQAWWWHWNGEDYAIPHIYSVMVSKSGGEDRYFIAFPDSRWCDEVGGFWVKIKYPNVPTREEQRTLASGPQPIPEGKAE